MRKVYHLSKPIVIDEAADPRFGEASGSEIRKAEQKPNRHGYYRVIGGDKGDFLFNGYTVEGDETIIESCALATTLTLTDDEAFEIATEVVSEAYNSVGIEAIY